MSASTSGVATPAEDGAGPGLRKLKILMLHGEYRSFADSFVPCFYFYGN
jgi:hypothetical protein